MFFKTWDAKTPAPCSPERGENKNPGISTCFFLKAAPGIPCTGSDCLALLPVQGRGHWFGNNTADEALAGPWHFTTPPPSHTVETLAWEVTLICDCWRGHTAVQGRGGAGSIHPAVNLKGHLSSGGTLGRDPVRVKGGETWGRKLLSATLSTWVVTLPPLAETLSLPKQRGVLVVLRWKFDLLCLVRQYGREGHFDS